MKNAAAGQGRGARPCCGASSPRRTAALAGRVKTLRVTTLVLMTLSNRSVLKKPTLGLEKNWTAVMSGPIGRDVMNRLMETGDEDSLEVENYVKTCHS